MAASDDNKTFGHEARQLNEEEIVKLLADNTTLSTFHRNKLEKDAKKNWDLFYKRNTNKFFRDRNWTIREFEELLDLLPRDEAPETKNLIEIGCGVGNFIWPLIKAGLGYNFYACDFSPVALDILKSEELYDPNKLQVFQSDLTEPNGLLDKLPDSSVRFHLASLIFVLSAINPEKMATAFANVYQVMADDGILLFRDYGLYDHAMLRFAPGHKILDNFYVRQDGTRAYYFTLDSIQKLATDAGFKILQLDYIKRETINIKEGLAVPRIFVQAKLTKVPSQTWYLLLSIVIFLYFLNK